MTRRLVFHKRFEKQFSALRQAQKERVKEALTDYANGEKSASLRIHSLSGDYKRQVSISAGGDLRLHLIDEKTSNDIVVLQVGTHSQLYG